MNKLMVVTVTIFALMIMGYLLLLNSKSNKATPLPSSSTQATNPSPTNSPKVIEEYSISSDLNIELEKLTPEDFTPDITILKSSY